MNAPLTLPRPVAMTLFDTREAWPHDQAQQEAVLYGDDMACVSVRRSDGSRFISLIGPDGSVDLNEDQWKHIFEAMGFKAGAK